MTTQEQFEAWWRDEGSGMPPLPGEDASEHVRRLCGIAWANGAYKLGDTMQEALDRILMRHLVIPEPELTGHVLCPECGVVHWMHGACQERLADVPCSVITADGYKIDPTQDEVYFYPDWADDKNPSQGLMEYSAAHGWTGYHGKASGPVFKTRVAVNSYISKRHENPSQT